MKLYTCQSCTNQLYFENSQCLRCGHDLGLIPGVNVLTAIEPSADAPGVWCALDNEHSDARWRKCLRYEPDGLCNWLVPVDDPNPLCRSCRMTRTIPDLTIPGNRSALRRLEAAKRRLLYGLTTLGLPVVDQHQDPHSGLAFEFLADTPECKVLTGHKEGVITVNILEADPVECERVRTSLRERYRTVLGHLRHESGHYYWDRLVAHGPRLHDVRSLFGDDREDYASAMQRHYDQGPRADWSAGFVSAYATMHPWEDWAETWSHYLHMVDAVEIAGFLGLSIRTRPLGSDDTLMEMTTPRRILRTFDELLDAWIPLTFATNCLTRSIGHQDWYPFVLSPGAIAKLRLVHEIIAAARGLTNASGNTSIPGSCP